MVKIRVIFEAEDGQKYEWGLMAKNLDRISLLGLETFFQKMPLNIQAMIDYKEVDDDTD